VCDGPALAHASTEKYLSTSDSKILLVSNCECIGGCQALSYRQGRNQLDPEQQTFLERLAAILDEAKSAHRYGAIEIELRDGTPVTIREVRTHKIADAGEINRAKQQRRY
jgi:hypothetical protein